ncbi:MULTISPECIES: hypothetical protein [unclassified Paenibacillus]|uniref:hypothetical protein n=1 Tax=unclassified Paenibacillus TaxID=185978 RepID=UPI0024060264|nr:MULTISPECIES: hypothetical protein [unclassified Paenibacillus]MDF9839481.1 fructoselysine-6-P-deglycase FrlB-like protein [Paenibacillus sp. PastF-2]MDF9846062.1 fructoselysine-6-P-deglycase FrlB-like protein [Paenibacillus sp. PastM-2]MDF9852635.1 fructoselysine-6-P-deglycase FrlB-like protein [Paenibacillus sp. PastF-1]MDH6477634.1 fructoselysine-6-P-deglycase FrlB-like protein [Paenibacillus sp. PastH-2]
MEKEASDIKVGLYNSNEFVHNTPKAFGENSVIVVASHKGNTPETKDITAEKTIQVLLTIMNFKSD